MMQGLFGLCAAGDRPHIVKSLIEIQGIRVANFDQPDFLVLAIFLEIIGGGPVAAPDVAFDYQGSPSLPCAKSRRTS